MQSFGALSGILSVLSDAHVIKGADVEIIVAKTRSCSDVELLFFSSVNNCCSVRCVCGCVDRAACLEMVVWVVQSQLFQYSLSCLL